MDWGAFFQALGTFVILPLAVLILNRGLRKNSEKAAEGRQAIVAATVENTVAVQAHAQVTEKVARETAGLRAVATGQINTNDPQIQVVPALSL